MDDIFCVGETKEKDVCVGVGVDTVPLTQERVRYSALSLFKKLIRILIFTFSITHTFIHIHILTLIYHGNNKFYLSLPPSSPSLPPSLSLSLSPQVSQYMLQIKETAKSLNLYHKMVSFSFRV